MEKDTKTHLEKYTINESETELRFVTGRNIVLNVEQNEDEVRARDSAKANSQTLADYKWESKISHNNGRILAVRENLLAYRLYNKNIGEAIRVMERETRARHLIKEFHHPIVDIQWALHSPLLAIVDSQANLYVYKVELNCKSLEKYLNIIRPQGYQGKVAPKVCWCPYVCEDEKLTDFHLLAIATDNKVDLLLLHVIKAATSRSEVLYDTLQSVPNALLTVSMNSEITSIKLSPDATALAISTIDGKITFYVLDNGTIRFASNMRPTPTNFVDDFLFLDNLTGENKKNCEQFWKYVVISSDSGRRLSIYNTEDMKCSAKLRFESQNQINKLEILVDPTARYIFVVDYDCSNLYCVQLNNFNYVEPYITPCFVSCTQISFCNPLLGVSCSKLHEPIEQDDLLMDDDENVSKKIVATFIAVNRRSVVELNIDLEKYDPFDVSPSKVLAPPKALAPQKALSPKKDTSSTSSTKSEEVVVQQQPEKVSKGQSKGSNGESVANNNNNNNEIRAVQEDFGMKLMEMLEGKFQSMSAKLDELTSEVINLRKENEEIKLENIKNMAKLKEENAKEIECRVDFIDQHIRAINDESRAQLLAKLEEVHSNLQSTFDFSRSNEFNSLPALLTQNVVPFLENICKELFRQLNQTVQQGLQSYVNQLEKYQDDM